MRPPSISPISPRLTRTITALLAAALLVASMGPGVGAAATASPIPGQKLWAARYDGPANQYDSATALGVSPDGSTVFVTGSSSGGAAYDDYATVAYDAAAGAELWATRYNGPGNSYDVANALGVSPDGSTVFVTGSRSGGATSDDYATVAYDAAAGAELWATRYNGPGNTIDVAFALGVSPDGSIVFVTGASYGGATDDYATVAYDAATGAELWAARYHVSALEGGIGTALGVSPDGSTVFVTGHVYAISGGGSDYATVAYDAATGAEVWAARYNEPGSSYDDATALGVSPDTSIVFVTGSSYGLATSADYATVAYDAATGAEVWAARYDGQANSVDVAYSLGVSSGGSIVFVTGYSYGGTTGGNVDYATVAYDAATGVELWVSRYNGPGNSYDFATALRVSPDGSTVFVTGYSDDGVTFNDYATVAYDVATGGEIWVARAGATGSDIATAIGVSPYGAAVFITGRLQVKADGRTDYGTIAYAT